MKPILAGVHHITPMLSLDCTYDPQAVAAWAQSVGCAVVAEPKLDGVAASVRYVDGNLESVATRGDGIIGRDITDRGRHVVPAYIRERGVVDVRGELIVSQRAWPSPFTTRADMRNAIAHATTCNSPWTLMHLGTVFVAYDIAGDRDKIPTEFIEASEGQFPCDGIVFKVANRQDRERLGSTRRSPRWAIAYKGEASALHGLRGLEDIPIPSVQL